MPKFLKTYSKRCPKCKAYFPGVWKECNVCKLPLVSAKVSYYMKWFKLFCALLILLAAVAASSYYLQPPERKQYEKGYAYLREGRYADAGEAWWQAFKRGPYYNGACSAIERIRSRRKNKK